MSYLPKPNDADFELPPAGTHMAVCYRVIDLGTQASTYMGQSKRQHKILLSWELPDEKMADGRPFTIGSRYTWSMSEKATLRHHLEAWRGLAFTEKDFGSEGFNIKNILGKGCILTITHASKDGGKTYANISSVGKIMKGMQPPSPINEQVYLWLESNLFEPSTFHSLSQNLQGVIMQSPEYQALANGHDNEPPPVESPDSFHSDDIPF